MKKTIAILLTLCLLALLCACGEPKEPAAAAPAPAAEEPAEKAPEAPEKEAASAEAASTEEAPAEESPAQTEQAPAEPSGLDTALTFVDQDAALLVQAIGQPLEESYEASCSGPGEDGVWTYDGFTVYTYRENGAETVVDAE